MKLLIITQKVDKSDPEALFFHRWLEEFAKHFSLVTVIALKLGQYDLPKNVKVLSLGKETNPSRYNYLVNFYHFIWAERRDYDAVFVHMNPEYVVLGGLLWKIWHKKIVLWYTHRQVNFKLRLAEKFSNLILTASKEGFGLKTKKLRVMGHGVDTEALSLPPANFKKGLVITHVGRITQIKHIEVIFRAAKKLIDSGLSVAHIDLTGAPVTEADKIYKTYLESLARELGLESKIHWSGIRPSRMAYEEASLTINTTPEGGMDKVVLESLAALRPVFTSNVAFSPMLGEYANIFLFDFNNPEDLAGKIRLFLKMPNKSEIINSLSEKVRGEYDVKKLVERIALAIS